uniref:Uncharacterized protein n=1 Tax=Clandestinovirus TaxID=2831644 RepID=A0A8F8KM18_9VIRU|nr:hypothetical protein KOM_12_359 [Clandestinovirus]
MSAPRMVLSGLNNRTMWRRTRPGSFSVNKLRAIDKADFRNSTVDFTDATIIGLQNNSSEQPFAYQGSVGNLDSTAVVDGTALTPMGKFLMPANGWLTALSLQYTNAILTGSITVELTVSGVEEGTTTHPLSVGEQQVSYDLGIIEFNEGDIISFNITTDNLTPVGPLEHLIIQLYYVLDKDWQKSNHPVRCLVK